MRTVSSVARAAAAALLILIVSGCETGTAPLAPVRGKVVYGGVAVSGGKIIFTPDTSRGGDGPIAQSDTAVDGSFILKTGNTIGARPGWYRITILALDSSSHLSSGQHFAVPRSLLPEKYRDPELSGLVREVKGGQENVIDFNLE